MYHVRYQVIEVRFVSKESTFIVQILHYQLWISIHSLK